MIIFIELEQKKSVFIRCQHFDSHLSVFHLKQSLLITMDFDVRKLLTNCQDKLRFGALRLFVAINKQIS